uniref:Uncharacterized protein n=1 Tax=Arundo donax TaxID=35708 RepID=A0A0A9DMY2_ARUDO
MYKLDLRNQAVLQSGHKIGKMFCLAPSFIPKSTPYLSNSPSYHSGRAQCRNGTTVNWPGQSSRYIAHASMLWCNNFILLYWHGLMKMTQGYIAGNPMTDKQFDTDGKYKFFMAWGLFQMNFTSLPKRTAKDDRYDPTANAQCAASIKSINYCTKDINEFHILEPSCKTLWGPITEKDEMSRLMLESGGDDQPFPFKCRSDSYAVIDIWANDETVRKRLGIRQGTIGEWKRCKFFIPYKKRYHKYSRAPSEASQKRIPSIDIQW